MNQHPIERAWLDSNVAHIESLAGCTLPGDVRRYVEDKLLSLLLDAVSYVAKNDDPAFVNVHRHFDDAPDVETALSRVALGFERFAECGIEGRFGG